MASPAVNPETLEERVIWHAITATWLYYAIGGLYILAPALGWGLLAWAGFKYYVQSPQTPPREHVRLSRGVKVWVGGMVMMEIALIAAHIDFNLGTGSLIKSSIGWAKGWALLAIFPVIGAALQIRPAVVYRASCRLAAQTLILIPLFVVAPVLHLPGTLYISPLQIVGGPGPEFFEIQLYGRDPDSHAPRWRFFTPWAPAAGFVANVYLIFAIQERQRKWKIMGIAASILMCLLSQSRLALISMIVVASATWFASRISRSLAMRVASLSMLLAGIWADRILEFVGDAKARFSAARAASSRVRATLGRIAVQRWKAEAPMWGHGVVERGPHLVEFMPIGSHHSWFGLLFVKGIVGFFALMVPVVWSLVEMLLKAQASRTARCGFSMMLILLLYSFGENLEILVYLYWPALIIVGIASRQRIYNPFISSLSGRKQAGAGTT
jgi:hypothetical protein